tara:strand:+ start:630 stop:2318 length:1689 start_codon:yes stop_codon:yes gene_type:complete
MAFVKYNLPCHKCGGSDPVGLNDNGSAWCFSCNTYFKNYDTSEVITDTITDLKTYQRNKKLDGVKLEFDNPEAVIIKKFNALTDRKISLETAKKYGVKSTTTPEGNIDKHYYPYYNGHEAVGVKVRGQDKRFSWNGESRETGLFGQNLFKEGGKYVTLVEGECDAMAAYELLGSKWPVVSIKSGAAAAERDVKNSLEFLESFDCIVINFDNDKHGKEAAVKVARLLTPGKAKILSLPEEFKDANDVLRQGRHSTYVSYFWDAKVYTPSGIVNLSEQFNEYCKYLNKKVESVPYPWKGLNYKLEGLRLGELVTLTGGTGLGKSSVTRELEYWLIKQTKDNIGIVALEESKFRTAEGLTSIEANACLHKDSVKSALPIEQVQEYYKRVFMNENNGRIYIHAHHGVTDLEEIFSKLRYMIVGLDCKWVVVDHLHMLVLSRLDSDERKSIDSIMHRLRTLVEETGCGMILVSHLRRLEGNRGHENGIETGLSHLRGSQSIAQLSDCVISLERNQQADDPIEASTTKVRVLKSRYTGDVGVATRLFYCSNSGRLNEVDHHDLDELEL